MLRFLALKNEEKEKNKIILKFRVCHWLVFQVALGVFIFIGVFKQLLQLQFEQILNVVKAKHIIFLYDPDLKPGAIEPYFAPRFRVKQISIYNRL